MKSKLEILEQPGSYKLLFDMMDILVDEAFLEDVTDEWKEQMIAKLRAKYKSLEPKSKFKQIKLFE